MHPNLDVRKGDSQTNSVCTLQRNASGGHGKSVIVNTAGERSASLGTGLAHFPLGQSPLTTESWSEGWPVKPGSSRSGRNQLEAGSFL